MLFVIRIEAGLTLTDLFLDSVLQLPLLPYEIADQLGTEGFVEAVVQDWDEIVTSNWRFLASFVFGAIMVVVSLVAFFGFCCSRLGDFSESQWSQLSMSYAT